jgi:hypothetical protein
MIKEKSINVKDSILSTENNLPTMVFNKINSIYQKKEIQEVELDFNFKLGKLKMLIDELLPDDLGSRLKSSLTNYKLRNCLTRDIATALSAIAESNRMQGHYSADKHLTTNVNMDLDLEHAKQVMQDLIKQHKKDY